MIKDPFPYYKAFSSKAICDVQRSAYFAYDADLDPLLFLQYLPTSVNAADAMGSSDPQVMCISPNCFGPVKAFPKGALQGKQWHHGIKLCNGKSKTSGTWCPFKC